MSVGDTGSAFSCASPLSSLGRERAEYSAKEKFSRGYGVLEDKGYVHVGMQSDFVFFSGGRNTHLVDSVRAVR